MQITQFNRCAKYRKTVHTNCAVQLMYKINIKSFSKEDFDCILHIDRTTQFA